MSTADLLEDGFPHAEPRGYDRGCRLGSHCPGIAEVGWSCEDAHIRYQGDYGYRRRVDDDWSPAEIAEWQKARDDAARKLAEAAVVSEDTAVEMIERVTDVKPRVPEFLSLDDESADVPAPTVPVKKPRLVEPKPKKAAEPSPAPKRKPKAQIDKPIVHGFPYGYQRGCQDHLQCPKGENGKTCWEAYREYQNDYTARRRENKGKVLGSNKGMPRGTRRQPAVEERLAEALARVAELEAILAGGMPADAQGRHRAEVAS